MKPVASSTQIMPVNPRPGHTAFDLGEVCTGDAILIWTQNSFYRFLVTEAGARRGRLTRGGQPVSAEEVTLVGVADESGRCTREQGAELTAGARALFRVAEGSLAPRLLTSPVARCSLIRAADRHTDEFNRETWEDRPGPRLAPLDQAPDEDSVESVFLLPCD